MKLTPTAALLSIALLAGDAPASAQDNDWLRELERRAEAIGRMVEAQIAALQARAPERQRRGGQEATEPWSHTVRLGRDGTFDLRTFDGDVVVNGADRDDIRIEATKRARAASAAEARRLIDSIEVEVIERGGRVEVRTRVPRRRGAAAAVDYSISLPARANVALRTQSGNLRIAGVEGEVFAETVNGDISAVSVKGAPEIQARSFSGNLEFLDSEGTEIEGTTVSGDVTVRNVTMRRIDLESFSGNLHFSNVESDRVELSTVSGDIEYAGRLTRSGRYELETHSGNVRVVPAGDTGFDVEANTFSGNVRSDYPLQGWDVRAFGLRPSPGRTLRGTFGSADATLQLTSFSGDVVIVKR